MKRPVAPQAWHLSGFDLLGSTEIDQIRMELEARVGSYTTEIFLPLARSLTAPGVAALRAQLDDHSFLARQAADQARARYGLARYATKVPMQLDSHSWADICRALLERYPALDDVGQCLVVGAVRYVIEVGDVDDDSDARIVTFVLERIESLK